MKFQDVSSAYEILVEPSTRAKYDTDRSRRYGQFSAFTSPTRNAPNPYANWPRPAQPPRPTQAPQPNNMKSPNVKVPPSVASQYARWTAGKGTWSDNNPGGPQSKADAASAFKAWEKMRAGGVPGRGTASAERGGPVPGRAAPPPQAPPPPNMASRGRTPRMNTFATATANVASQQATPKARAGWDQFDSGPQSQPGLSRAKTMRTPKKGGFDPAMDTGDEPPVRNTSAYYNLHRGSIPHAARPQPFQPRPTSQTNAPKPEPVRTDPFKGFRSPKSEENFNDRLSTPYATSGGEKTYFSSHGLSRNPSTDSASNLKSGWEQFGSAQASPRSPHERHRSASPRMRSPNPQQSSSSSDESSADDTTERPKLRPRGFAARRAQAKANGSINHTNSMPHSMPPRPQPSVTVENPNGETFEFGKPSKRSTWSAENANGDPNQPEKLSASDAAFRRTSTGDLPEGIRKSQGSERGSAPPSPLHAAWTNDEDDFEPLEKTTSWQDASAHRHFDPPEACGPQPKYGRFPFAQFALLKKLNFQLPLSSSATFEKGPSRFQHHNVLPSKRAFQEEIASPSPINWNKGSLHAMMNRTDQRRFSLYPTYGHVAGPGSPLTNEGPDRSASQFSQHVWQQKFSDETANPFSPGPKLGAEPRGRASPVKSRPTTANKTPRKMSTATKRPTFPVPASASATSSESEGKSTQAPPMSKQSSAGRSSNGSAMDIDSNIPPSVSEMRSTHDPLGNTIRSQAPNKTPTASAAASPTRGATADGTNLNLDDLTKSAPFTPSNANGLGDLGDIKSNLPFKSQAAATLPIADIHPHNLALPNPPRPPKPPNVAALTQGAYDYYMVFVRTYMAEWNMYNKKMLAHYHARQNMIENNLPKHWLDAVGQEGHLRYMAWMEEDKRVRAHWDVSYEKHIEAMKTLGTVRSAVMAGKLVG